MTKHWFGASLVALSLSTSWAHAQETAIPDPIEPEELVVEAEIAPGPNVFVASPSWGGAGAVTILSADDLSYKGNFATGMTTQFFLGPDAAVGYVASAFPERITYGPVKAYFQKFDVNTLETTQEIEIPPQFAQTQAQQPGMSISADGKWAYIQNATPATSVTVLDLKAGTVASEIPNPGCWGIYLAEKGLKFSSLCGDGTMLTVELNSKGKLKNQAYSDPIFDVDADPLYVHSQRIDGNLVFTTYGGTFVTVSDKGKKATVLDSWSYTDGIEGDWAPGGYEILAYNEPNGIMFVPMHPDAKDGSHKNGATELWAIDMKAKTVLYRSYVEHMTHIAVTDDAEAPVLFGVNSHGGDVYRYEIDPTAKFAAKFTDTLQIMDAGYLVVK
ncbi:amine dehydrogenase large subunit [Hyphomonas sp.]|uniref:amine dehydrogenase large subunit n=1 Tax=Hyphomonas sp. TaxID=87 RepID=UPI0035295A4C